MSTYAIKADAFYLPTRVARGGYLMVEDGVFGAYVTEKPDCDIVDYSGKRIRPPVMLTPTSTGSTTTTSWTARPRASPPFPAASCATALPATFPPR